MYTLFIALHAVTASVALVAAVMARRRARWLATYEGALVAMLMFLVLAVAWDLRGRSVVQHVVVVALVALGGVMIAKAEQARRARHDPGSDVTGLVGFGVIGLVDAFVIVALVNAGLPGWLVGVAGGAIAAGGHAVIHRLRQRERGSGGTIGTAGGDELGRSSPAGADSMGRGTTTVG